LIADNYKFFTILQGFPAAITLGGIDLTTTDELAITEFSPIVTPLSIEQLLPINTLFSITTFPILAFPFFRLSGMGDKS
jgi:hypothetical protein